jgi:DNA polymerase-3 subunit epsilon
MTIQKNFREIVLDLETTGLSWERGDRIVEIACVELVNYVQTGNTYQVYVNPQRAMHKDAIAISGITDEFLRDKPLFSEVVDDFLKFVGNSGFIIHNAKFDIGFLNCELKRLNRPSFKLEEAVDTLEIARRRFPGSPVNLDALCRRFNIDNSKREKHGALIDCFLLADVYLNLIGGKQSSLAFSSGQRKEETCKTKKEHLKRVFNPTSDEKADHKEFIETLVDPLWNKYYNN